jgi:UPF0716 family protein affecting phage T7 exclusion
MEPFLNAIQKTPLPTILIFAGLIFLLLGFVTKLEGILEVSPEQRRWAIPIGLLIIVIGLVLNFATPTLNKISIPSGSYLRTCKDISVQGDDLFATCTKNNGQDNTTFLEKFNDCKSGISNIDGSLQCQK